MARWVPTGNAVIWWCNASRAATRRGGAPLRRYKSEETVSKTGEKGIANSLTFKIFSVKYARWEVCVYTIFAHNQIIHDMICRNLMIPAASQMAVCHWIIVHSFLLMHISLKTRRRRWHPTPVLLPGKSHGRRSLVGCSPWGLKESDTTEWLHFHFSLPCIGEGNGNPLQYSCLENPRNRGAWQAAI